MNLLANRNPVARLSAIVAMTTPLLLSVDWVSAAVVVVAMLIVAPLCGIGPRRLAYRAWPLLVAAPLAAISMLLFGAPAGESLVHWGFIHITTHSIALAVAIAVRVLAIGLPVVVLSADIDPTDLGDGLSQVLRLPDRFVIASVAGVRLIGLLRDDLDAIRRARRARGLADRHGSRYWLSISFSVLVSALRRAAKLATAMEARGFGRHNDRTWARTSRLDGLDVALMVAGVVLGVGAVGCAIAVGEFRFLGVAS